MQKRLVDRDVCLVFLGLVDTILSKNHEWNMRWNLIAILSWYKGYSTIGLCHSPPRMKNQCGAQEENLVGEKPHVGVRWTHVYVGSLTVTTNKRKSL